MQQPVQLDWQIIENMVALAGEAAVVGIQQMIVGFTALLVASPAPNGLARAMQSSHPFQLEQSNYSFQSSLWSRSWSSLSFSFGVTQRKLEWIAHADKRVVGTNKFAHFVN